MHDLMELPSNPGTKTPVQLVELRRRLSKHEVPSDQHERPGQIACENRFWKYQQRLQAHLPRPSPTLLGIPKPLRANILNFILPTGTRIAVSPTEKRPHEPPILQTTHLLRVEASWIYYPTNTFHFHIHNFDASALIAWLADTPAKDAKRMAPIQLRMLEPEQGVECWGRLVEWLKGFYEGKVVGLSVAEGSGEEGPESVEAARRLFREVDGLRRLEVEVRPEWKQVLERLGEMRMGEEALW
ncbi:hypothetical protein M409DRAFT_28074 [Zasmidium cellare ATCC 36951]|uniref:Uncharacterized protein n=1 Tax=Zasmidium cellare ATCC 36951 TaxID=1080233 RepID=A0A6A6C3G1_ZASCE|nr:uncharacterized protein M409DRAFT_28074 [Zasmidium cellare ATCC 36951]KAF2161677.1 hypothetical protein M409DRAFT_28074 [Zasmidium cellare ATCC 36951]